MKCVKSKDGTIKRVTNEKADVLVKIGWNFCPKQEWKEKVRINIKMEEKEGGKTKKMKTNQKVKKTGKHKGDIK